MAVLIYGAWCKVKRPFQGFSTFDLDQLGKTCRHHSKERLKGSEIAKFESDTPYAREVTAPQKLRKFTDVCMLEGKYSAFISVAQTLGAILKHTFQRHKRLTTGHPNVNRPPSVPSWETLLFFAADNRHGTSPSFAHTIS